MRIVAAPNAFKGSLNAVEAAEAMKKGILAAIPLCHVVCVPVADGGDGLTEVMLHGMGGQRIEKMVSGPRMEVLSAPFCLVASRNLAVVEMARVFRSVLALAVEPARRPACLDEMVQDLVHFHWIHDHGEDLHRAAALGTLKRIHLIDLGDQPCPRGGCGLTFGFL